MMPVLRGNTDNRLINYSGDNNEVSPSLAKSWHITRDGKKITFYLRKDVEFHHTSYFKPSRKLNADDVLFSFVGSLITASIIYK